MKNLEIPKNNFTPITIGLIIETKEERSAIRDMLSLNRTIPELVEGKKNVNGKIIQEFMDILSSQIDKGGL